MKEIFFIGYSGHAYVCMDIAQCEGYEIMGYFEQNEKIQNPFNLKYFGREYSIENKGLLSTNPYFIGIGDGKVRQKITLGVFSLTGKNPVSLAHPSAVIAQSAQIDSHGTLLAAGVVINPLAVIGCGTICNTNSTIEHECKIGMYAHIAPGAVLAGNVTVGNGTFIGANSVVKQGVTIGNNVTIGAGTVVLRDVPDNTILIGNPGRSLSK